MRFFEVAVELVLHGQPGVPFGLAAWVERVWVEPGAFEGLSVKEGELSFAARVAELPVALIRAGIWPLHSPDAMSEASEPLS